jgi:hypothetical protein
MPEDADYLDIASGAEPGRFTFVGMKSRIGEYVIGRWADALTPAVEWIVPGEPDLNRAIAAGGHVYVGGSAGTIVRWQGSAASAEVEMISGAETVADLALGETLLVATTVTTGTTTGLTYKCPRDGGAWEPAGVAKNFRSVVYNTTTSKFLLAGPDGFYSIHGDDLGKPEITRFTFWPQLRAAAAGDYFYATGPSDSFARIAADGIVTEFHERPFEWPFYEMAGVADQLLMFSRFGRVLFTYLGIWLELGIRCPRTTSLIERLMREIGRRLKKIAFGWSESGAAKMARMVIARILNPTGWREHWEGRQQIAGNAIIVLLGVDVVS